MSKNDVLQCNNMLLERENKDLKDKLVKQQIVINNLRKYGNFVDNGKKN